MPDVFGNGGLPYFDNPHRESQSGNKALISIGYFPAANYDSYGFDVYESGTIAWGSYPNSYSIKWDAYHKEIFFGGNLTIDGNERNNPAIASRVQVGRYESSASSLDVPLVFGWVDRVIGYTDAIRMQYDTTNSWPVTEFVGGEIRTGQGVYDTAKSYVAIGNKGSTANAYVDALSYSLTTVDLWLRPKGFGQVLIPSQMVVGTGVTTASSAYVQLGNLGDPTNVFFDAKSTNNANLNIFIRPKGTGSLQVASSEALIGAGLSNANLPFVVTGNLGDATAVWFDARSGNLTNVNVNIRAKGAAAVKMLAGGFQFATFSTPGGTNDSALSLTVGTTPKLVTQGAVDSGGAGFKLLRVPN